MGHKHNHHKKKKRKDLADNLHQRDVSSERSADQENQLEVVLKCDSEGSLEAITSSLSASKTIDVDVSVISAGVGDVNKNDLLMAGTAGRLVLGYEVDVNTGLDNEVYTLGVEIRLYQVIYRLLEDLKEICSHVSPPVEDEVILGRAKVIKLFKSTRKGIILGCEVASGRLARGDKFRVIGAMGEVYNGRVGSLHIENDAVNSAGKGKNVGLKIEGFKNVSVGDYVECVKHSSGKLSVWKPVPGVINIT